MRWLLAIAAILTVGAVLGIPQIEPQVDFVDTVPEHAGLQPYRDMLATLDGVRFVAIYMSQADNAPNLRSDAGFDALVVEQGQFTRDMEERFPGQFTHSLSVWEAMRQGNYMFAKLATGGNPPESSYSVPSDPATYPTIRDQVRNDNVGDVLAADGTSSLMLFFLATSDEQEARSVAGEVGRFVATWESQLTAEHQASGLAYSSYAVDQQNEKDLRTWGLVAAAAAALAMLWALRNPASVGLAALGTTIALVWTFGLIGWLGISVSFLTLFLAPVVAGIGIDFSMHLLHNASTLGMKRAVRETGPAIAVGAVTTAGGLVFMALVPAPLFSEIGWTAALAVGLGVVATFTVVMPLGSQTTHIPKSGALAHWSRFARRNPLPVVAVVFITLMAAFMATTGTRIESGAADNELPQDDPLIQLQHRIEEEYGAFERAYLVVQGDIADARVLAALERATGEAQDLPLARQSSSITDLLLADANTDEGVIDIAGGGSSGLPRSDAEARQKLDALYEDPLWRSLAPFVITRDYQLAIIAIEVDPWESQAEMVELRDAMLTQAQDLQDEAGPSVAVAAAGRPVNRAAIVEQTPIDLGITIGGSLAVVALGLGAFQARRGWAGLRITAVAVGSLFVATLWLLATIPVLDAFNPAALNNMFLLAFAITVAVGIDDWIHLTNRYWRAVDAGEADPVAAAFESSGRAITGTTLTTFAAFAVLGFVYFLQSKNLAILTATGVASAYLLAMALAPWALGGRLKGDDATAKS